MKKLLVLLFCGLLAMACSKVDGYDLSPDKDWPQLPDQEDVCSDMDDIVFKQYCYDNFDDNKDGSLSTSEALAVKSIDLADSKVNDLKGIEHFQNLESLNCENCKNLESVDLSRNVKITKIGDSAFANCTNLVGIKIPDSVTKIGRAAFFDCRSLLSITIPNSVTEIGDTTFYNCINLENVNIPNNITTIVFAAFYGCTRLTSITIPDSVTTIEESAFFDCQSLLSITIPGSVTKIESEAFYECTNLSTVYCKPTTPPQLERDAFAANSFTQTIYVPTESVSAYKAASEWSKYSFRIVGYDFQ